jgi:hypothetical protein
MPTFHYINESKSAFALGFEVIVQNTQEKEIHRFLRLLGRRCVAGALLPPNLEDKRPPSYRANERTRPTKAKPR